MGINKLLHLFPYLAKRGHFKWMPDKTYLRIMYYSQIGKQLHIDNPKTFNEKLQWLKINDRKDIYTTIVDKCEAKTYVSERIGSKYIIPTYGVWDKYEDIDFDKLPDQFVLKCTHDSGGLIICYDKSHLDKCAAERKIKKSLKNNYYYFGREWPYKNVRPRIIAEKLMVSNDPKQRVLNDYKLQCFNGKFDNIMVCEGRFSVRGVRYYYFDRDWTYIPYCPYDDLDYSILPSLKPQCFEEMIRIAEVLSLGFPQLRVDLYEIDGCVYFGELTLFSQSGFDNDITPEADIILGSKLDLTTVRKDR